MMLPWILQGLLGAAFLFHGTTKLIGAPFQRRMFDGFGYSQRLRIAVGAAEVIGGALVLFPATALFGVLWLLPVLAGIVYTHVKVEGAPSHAMGAVLHLALGVGVAIVRWPDVLLP